MNHRNLLLGLVHSALLSTCAIMPAMSAAAEPVRNIVLVHGAFTDGSIWSDVVVRLQAKGFTVTSVQNPLTSLAADIEATKRVLRRQKSDTLIVGHSWAGAVVTAAANEPNVRGIAYVSALVPGSNESVAEMFERQAVPMEALHADQDGLIWLDEATFGRIMAGDVAPAKVRLLTAMQQPIAAQAFGERIGLAAWRDKPSFYLLTQGDAAVPEALQRKMAKEARSTVTTLASSHLSMVSKPQAVSDFIERAAQTLP
ncbi:alpha/beta hydrolase [Achromobacter dolens]|uniref:alpha/beta hydrolase n=1 Tax=Achromobacter dolens TaxID=1287738 RepID=UPI000A417649|nr:alpha/beta hydrolase [Achromobacter dolens]CAB3646035.1 Pyrethroid hydrolase [Achromobacter dolens]